MAPTRPIDVQDFMNHHKLSSYQIRIIALCFLIVAIDGFDTAAIGFIGGITGTACQGTSPNSAKVARVNTSTLMPRWASLRESSTT